MVKEWMNLIAMEWPTAWCVTHYCGCVTLTLTPVSALLLLPKLGLIIGNRSSVNQDSAEPS